MAYIWRTTRHSFGFIHILEDENGNELFECESPQMGIIKKVVALPKEVQEQVLNFAKELNKKEL